MHQRVDPIGDMGGPGDKKTGNLVLYPDISGNLRLPVIFLFRDLLFILQCFALAEIVNQSGGFVIANKGFVLQ